jgi:RIO-like serine/threonine protein kinase
MEKMHEAGIWHGDMHVNNILVQIQPSGKPKVIIIDYGRSKSRLFGNANRSSYNRNMYNLIKGYARVYNTTPKKAVGRLNMGSLIKLLNATPPPLKAAPAGLHKTPKTKRLRIGKKLCLAMAVADLRKYAKFAGVSDEGTKEQICERLYRLV